MIVSAAGAAPRSVAHTCAEPTPDTWPQNGHGLGTAAACMNCRRFLRAKGKPNGVFLMSRENERSEAGTATVRRDTLASGPPALDADEAFRQSMANLSRQLASRVAKMPPPLLSALPHLEPRAPPGGALTSVARWALGIVALACGLYAFTARQQPRVPRPTAQPTAVVPTTPAAAALPAAIRSSAAETAASPSAPGDSAPPPSAAVMPAPSQPTLPTPAPSAPSQSASAASDAPQQAPATRHDQPLEPYEIMEVQSRLKSLGFDPGLLDGAPGARTREAARRYEAARGRAAVAHIDRDLLAELRTDRAAVEGSTRPASSSR